MDYLRKKCEIVRMSDIYDLPGVDSGYGFSIGGYGGDLKDNIINYDTMLAYLYDGNIDMYHKGLLNRPLIFRMAGKGAPSFELLYTNEEIKTLRYRHKIKSLQEYGIHYISDDGVKWYRCTTFEDLIELDKALLNKWM